MALSAAAPGGGYSWRLPRGFPEPAVPADNPMNEAKVALGARLFADPRLSINGRYLLPELPCPRARLHRRPGAFARRHRRGIELNAPTLFNVAYNASLGWSDAGVRTLEQQMRGPMFNEHPPELGLAGREARRGTGTGGRPGDRAGLRDGIPGRAAPGVHGKRDPRDRRLRTHAVGRRLRLRSLRVRRRTRRRSMPRRSAAWSCSFHREPAARPATAASISREPGWIATQPAAAAGVRRHRHGQVGAGSDPAQSLGHGALHARRALRHARCRARPVRAARGRPGRRSAPAARATNYRRNATTCGVSCASLDEPR